MPTIAKHALDQPNQPYNINVVDFDKKVGVCERILEYMVNEIYMA